MTKVDWNKKNIFNLVKLLKINVTDSSEALFDNYLKANLGVVVASLRSTKNQFREVVDKITFLSDSILSALNYAQQLASKTSTLEEVINIANDPLRVYKLFELAVTSIEKSDTKTLITVLEILKKQPHSVFLKYITMNPDEAKKVLSNNLFLNLLKEILTYEVKNEHGFLVSSNRDYFKMVFPILRGILGEHQLLDIVKEILKDKEASDLDKWGGNEYTISLLDILSGIGTKEAIDLIESKFIPMKSHFINYKVIAVLMLSEHSMFFKKSIQAFDFLVNKRFVSIVLLKRELVERMEKTGQLPTIDAWKMIYLLGRKQLVFLKYNKIRLNENGRRSYLTSKEKLEEVLEIVDTANAFIAKYQPNMDPCEILLH